jgi:hypothetical protein
LYNALSQSVISIHHNLELFLPSSACCHHYQQFSRTSSRYRRRNASITSITSNSRRHQFILSPCRHYSSLCPRSTFGRRNQEAAKRARPSAHPVLTLQLQQQLLLPLLVLLHHTLPHLPPPPEGRQSDPR